MEIKKEKTNVMRLLDHAKICYQTYYYDASMRDGISIATMLQEPMELVFKTLVTKNEKKEHFVFVIPVNETLDLKKAAKASSSKSIEMIPQKELLPLTGYIHGGVSPIGMKKSFPTFFDVSSMEKQIYVSGGKVGTQIYVLSRDLLDYCHAKYVDIVQRK